MYTPTSRLAFLATVAVALATVGCESTQPDEVTSQTASVSVSALAKVDNNDCWEVWVDQDGNSVPDENTGQIYCEPVTDEVKVIRPVPWRYSLVIAVVRAGKTTTEVIAASIIPGDGIPDFVSMTPYDTTVENAATKDPIDNVYFINGKRVSSGSEYYLNAAGYDLGEPNVLAETPTYDFNVNPGDTIIVQARKQPYSDAPPYLNFDQDPEVTISGNLTIAGGPVQVLGTRVSDGNDKAGFSFSYTRN